MGPESPASLQEAMERAESGDATAREALFALLYDELHRLAHTHVARARGAMTWNTTTLLHEAYLGLARREGLQFPDENRFLGYAARAMRGLVIDAIRSRYTEKRGIDLMFVPVAEAMLASVGSPEEVEQLNDALADLARLEPALAELVDLAFFCGFTFAEIAEMRGVTERTVQRDWAKARLLLHGALGRT
ncbi:MAG: sigma-70 family RNA polymerase sigma factor [Thermoanaerobaculia bacterium]|jgi:RNA polymerase sigma factor (TIGR02999 family)|nr:sigma-70 family RNA polymerase sigma factor [Thermoanaerobaculia bacterium]